MAKAILDKYIRRLRGQALKNGMAMPHMGRVVLSNQRQLVLACPCSRLLALDVVHYPAQGRSADS